MRQEVSNKDCTEGCEFKGDLHSESGIKSSNLNVEVEDYEIGIVKEVANLKETITIHGTNKQILSKINVMAGGDRLYSDTGKAVKQASEPVKLRSGMYIVTRKAVIDPKEHKYTGTPLQIISQINENAGGVTIQSGAQTHYENGGFLTDSLLNIVESDSYSKGGELLECNDKYTTVVAEKEYLADDLPKSKIELIKLAGKYYRENIQNIDSITNKATGYKISFNKDGRQETLHIRKGDSGFNMTKNKYLAVVNLVKILENASFVGKEELRHNKDNKFICFLRFRVNFKTSKGCILYDIGVKVRKDESKLQYSLNRPKK